MDCLESRDKSASILQEQLVVLGVMFAESVKKSAEVAAVRRQCGSRVDRRWPPRGDYVDLYDAKCGEQVSDLIDLSSSLVFGKLRQGREAQRIAPKQLLTPRGWVPIGSLVDDLNLAALNRDATALLRRPLELKGLLTSQSQVRPTGSRRPQVTKAETVDIARCWRTVLSDLRLDLDRNTPCLCPTKKNVLEPTSDIECWP